MSYSHLRGVLLITMKVEQFLLERWLQKYDSMAEYNLAHASGIPIKLGHFLDRLDEDLDIHYTAGNGQERLREEVSNLYSDIDKDNILITNGTTEANYLTANYLIEPGEEVVVIMPTYPQIPAVLKTIGARVKTFQITEENAASPDLDQLQEIVTRKTKVILFTNPNNPIGYVFYKDNLARICQIAEDVGAYVWADEIFRGLEYEGGTPPTVLDLYEKAIVTSGLSKMALAGLRIGWVASDKKLVNGVWNFKDYTTTCNNAIGEHIAILALEGGNITYLRERCKRITKEPLSVLSDWIEKGKETFSWFKPKAGYVAFPRFQLKVNTRQFCRELIEEKGVLLTPGDCFGFPNHIRIGYGKVDRKTLSEALDLVDDFIERYM
jgi:aspartate/methionine/tyrosine aminotransferase